MAPINYEWAKNAVAVGHNADHQHDGHAHRERNTCVHEPIGNAVKHDCPFVKEENQGGPPSMGQVFI